MVLEPPSHDDERSYPPDAAILRAFYLSRPWRQLSYDMKLAAKWRCQCCGAHSSDGVRIVTDHIKPVRFYWHLRLDSSNLQVLCEDCNLGKASRDQTDHRTDGKERLLAAIKEFREPMRPQKLKDAITDAYSFGAISQDDAIAMMQDFGLVHE